MSNLIAKAIHVALDAHRDQKDLAGRPYILHALWVGLQGETDAEVVAGILHDVVEDSQWTIEDLRGEGFPHEILGAVQALTKRAGEGYEAYLERVKGNDVARAVKILDLAHNLQRDRIAEPTTRDERRWEKYEKAASELRAYGEEAKERAGNGRES